MDTKTEAKEKLVLVVDDDSTIVASLVEFLGKEGFRTVSAYDGKQTLKTITQNRPDLILLDMILPGELSGYEIVKKLQEDYFTKSIPVIMISVKKVDPGTKELFTRESNVLEFLSKPIKLPLLALKLHNLLKTITPDEKFIQEYRKKTAEENLDKLIQ